MKNTKQQFFPGDRVRITEDVDELEIERPDQTFILATKGSIGVIVTPEEFWVYYVEHLKLPPCTVSGKTSVAGKYTATIQFLTPNFTEVIGDLIGEHFAVDHESCIRCQRMVRMSMLIEMFHVIDI